MWRETFEGSGTCWHSLHVTGDISCCRPWVCNVDGDHCKHSKQSWKLSCSLCRNTRLHINIALSLLRSIHDSSLVYQQRPLLQIIIAGAQLGLRASLKRIQSFTWSTTDTRASTLFEKSDLRNARHICFIQQMTHSDWAQVSLHVSAASTCASFTHE